MTHVHFLETQMSKPFVDDQCFSKYCRFQGVQNRFAHSKNMNKRKMTHFIQLWVKVKQCTGTTKTPNTFISSTELWRLLLFSFTHHIDIKDENKFKVVTDYNLKLLEFNLAHKKQYWHPFCCFLSCQSNLKAHLWNTHSFESNTHERSYNIWKCTLAQSPVLYLLNNSLLPNCFKPTIHFIY